MSTLKNAIIAGSSLAVLILSFSVPKVGHATSDHLASSGTISAIPAADIVGSQLVTSVPVLSKIPVPEQNNRLVYVKLTDASGIRLRSGKFVETRSAQSAGGASSTASAPSVLQLESIMSGAKPIKLEKIFKTDEVRLDADQIALSTKSGKKLSNLNTWLQLELADNQSAEQTITSLKALDSVETAYLAPTIVDAASPDLVPSIGYQVPALDGLDVRYSLTSGIAGARGQKVKVIDIERGWNLDHEDLTKLKDPAATIGAPSTDLNNDHGTAVTGVLFAGDNGFGVTGMVPDAQPGLIVATGPQDYELARQNLSPGDVIVQPQGIQYFNPDGTPGGSVPLEHDQAWYDAISTAVAAGIIVVEPAGNGGQNFDTNPDFANTVGTPGRPNSGAIIVGAGYSKHANCDFGYPTRGSTGANSGSRLDVQGPGVCVTTTGYGDATPGAAKNSSYTYTFNGTSSASAVIGGAAAILSSAFEAQNGRPATPQEVKDLLKYQASPQDTTSPVLPTTNIGPLPNLKAGLNNIRGVINKAPTVPTVVTASNQTTGAVKVAWKASTDDGIVARYEVRRVGPNGSFALVGTVLSPTLTYVDNDVSSGVTYSYQVRAQDNAGKYSAFSAVASVTTAPPFFTDNFSTSALSKWSRNTNMTITQVLGNAKARAFSSPAAMRAAFAQKDFKARNELFAKAEFRIPVSSNTDITLFSVRSASNGTITNLIRQPSGKLAVYSGTTRLTVSSATTLALNTAYIVESRTFVSGTHSRIDVWVNGAKLPEMSTDVNLGTQSIARFQIGETATNRSFTMTFDDVALSGKYIP
jgi:serine protease